MTLRTKQPLKSEDGIQPQRSGNAGTLGLFFDGIPIQPYHQPVFGATVAGQAIYQALLNHGKMECLEFFSSPGQLGTAMAQITQWLEPSTSPLRSVRVQSLRELLDHFEKYPFTVWYDPGMDFKRLFHLRAQYARTLYPITFTHHTISYSSMLHEELLRLLLFDPFPCDSVICTSRAARATLSHLLEHVKSGFNRQFGTHLDYRGRLDLIPLGIDTQLFQPRDKEDLRYQLGLPKDAFILLWFGRFSAADKMDLLPLLRVFNDLVKDHPERKLLLILAGTEVGGYSSIVDRYAGMLGLQNHVHLLLNFPSQQRHLLFAASDVFVSPCDNIQETFGLTPIEAMACGVPQVVSDWDGYKDTVAHGETGFLVPTYWTRCDTDLSNAAGLFPAAFDHLSLAQSVVVDLNAYRQSLQQLIRNDDLRMRMGAASRERALSHFSWPVIIAQYEALWMELAKVASKTPFTPERQIAYTRPPYFDAFSGYATSQLPEDLPLRLTESGMRLLKGEELLPSYPAMAETLDEGLLRQALEAMKIGGRLWRTYRLGTLAEDVAESRCIHPDLARRHVMWLLKYGFIEPKEGYASGSSTSFVTNKNQC